MNCEFSFDTIAQNTLTWAIIAGISSIVALIVACLGIYSNRLFPRLDDAERLDSTESFVRLLIQKSGETIDALVKTCKSVAAQMREERLRDIEMQSVPLRTTYFRDITHARLFEVMVLSRIAKDKKEQSHSFLLLSDAIAMISGIQGAVLRDFADYTKEEIFAQDNTSRIAMAIQEFANVLMSPRINGEMVEVLPGSFEESFLKVYISWTEVSSELKEEILSAEINDAYYLLNHLVMPLREVALNFKSLPVAIQLLTLTNTYHYYFQKLDHVKKRYANVFDSYAVALAEHEETIEKEANALLSNSRTDFDYKMRFIRRASKLL